MPAIAVGTRAIAAQAEILRMSSFCRVVTSASAALTSVVSISSKVDTRSATTDRWSSTSRKYSRISAGTSGCGVPDSARSAGRQRRDRPAQAAGSPA